MYRNSYQITENILDGNWIETGAMICLDGRGVCTDGYHRLNAIRKSGVGVWVVVKQTSGFNKRHQ